MFQTMMNKNQSMNACASAPVSASVRAAFALLVLTMDAALAVSISVFLRITKGLLLREAHFAEPFSA